VRSTASNSSSARAPEIRTTAIPASPGAVDNAAMVSEECFIEQKS
jgi:hypothetical protein